MSSSGNRSVVNDRYEIERRIGRGGMADVFLARDLLLDRPVAIKVLFPEFATDPAFVERFRREAQAAANLTHPNIVAVYDWGRAGTTYFMAMEYVPGRTLADVLKSNGRLTAHQASTVALEVAAALAFAHHSGVVHRDIKPANILIGDNGQMKVADFGIARALGSSVEANLTQAGAVMGTATYFSPEQAQGGQPDPRSDLYSLGVVLYEMVAGRPPFSGDTPVSIAYKQVHDTPPPLRGLVADLPRPFEAIVARLLAKSPDSRYPTAESVRDDLRRFREGKPVEALEIAKGARAEAPTEALAATMAVPTDPENVPTRAMPRQMSVDQPPVEDVLPRRAGWFLLASVIVAVALVLGGIGLYRALTDEQVAASLTVPDVTGSSLREATTTLIDAGLNPVPRPTPRDGVGDDVVYAQQPAPETPVERGTEIVVTYNPAPVPVTVPTVIGVDLDTANEALTARGLRAVVVDLAESAEVPEGLILSQVPAAGVEVRPGETIEVVLSSGANQVVIPNVRGQMAQDASALLTGDPYGFTVTPVEEPSETVAAGAVIGTEPAIGNTVPRGESIVLVVSSGTDRIAMPSLVGADELDVDEILGDLGLFADITYVTVPFESPDAGIVLSQSIAPTVLVDPGTVVRLRVGVAAVPTTTTTTLAPDTTLAPEVPDGGGDATTSASAAG